MKSVLIKLISLSMIFSLIGCSNKIQEEKNEPFEEELVSLNMQSQIEVKLLSSNGNENLLNASYKTEDRVLENDTKKVKSHLPADVESVLHGLNTDYNKVNWDCESTFYDDIPGIVGSYKHFTVDNREFMLVAITNLYDIDVEFEGKFKVLDENDNAVGDSYLFYGAIGPGSTIIRKVVCTKGKPSGKIYWDKYDIKASTFFFYIPWMMDIKAYQRDRKIEVEYSLSGYNYTDIIPGTEVSFLMLDKNGDVLVDITDSSKEVPSNGKYKGVAYEYVYDETVASRIQYISVFANPTAYKQ